MNDAAATWTDERVEQLKKLWADGLSASQIAAELGGGVSRNAVIGKVHRLGLSGRVKTGTPAAAAAAGRAKKPLPTREPSAPVGMAPAPAPETPEPAPRPIAPALQPLAVATPAQTMAAPASERVTIMELREAMCRWPLGDPTTPEFRFCGARSITGLPYCTHHAQVAYQPAADRRRDRRLMAG